MSEGQNRKRLHALVSGRVQGIGFRHYVKTSVDSSCPEVTGRIRNLHDGRVEVIAEGPEDELQTLLSILRDGPRMAVVENVKDSWGDARGDFAGMFAVTYPDGSTWSV